MSFSNYLEDKVLNHVFGGSAYTAPTTLYIALLTSAPDDTSTGVSGQSNSIAEVSGSGTGYTRKSATFTVSGTAPTQASNSVCDGILGDSQPCGGLGFRDHRARKRLSLHQPPRRLRECPDRLGFKR